jgi:hypothetical protein
VSTIGAMSPACVCLSYQQRPMAIWTVKFFKAIWTDKQPSAYAAALAAAATQGRVLLANICVVYGPPDFFDGIIQYHGPSEWPGGTWKGSGPVLQLAVLWQLHGTEVRT